MSRRRFHIRSEACSYGLDTATEIGRILEDACKEGFEPIGIILTPGSGVSAYAVTVFLKAPCEKADDAGKFCVYCSRDTEK
jgi:hypothetical protein